MLGLTLKVTHVCICMEVRQKNNYIRELRVASHFNVLCGLISVVFHPLFQGLCFP